VYVPVLVESHPTNNPAATPNIADTAIVVFGLGLVTFFLRQQVFHDIVAPLQVDQRVCYLDFVDAQLTYLKHTAPSWCFSAGGKSQTASLTAVLLFAAEPFVMDAVV